MKFRRTSAVKGPLTKRTQVVNQSESPQLGVGTLSDAVRQRHSLMFRPRSYMAFAITPQPPIVDWLCDLDASFGRSESFFAGQHVALDLSAVNLSSNAIGQLVANLEERNISILGIEGVDPAKWQSGLPPVLRSDRVSRNSKSLQLIAPAAPAPTTVPTQKQQPASLMIEDPVRSGQSVIFMEGDVTILGSVGSGAEIVAGGPIHVYGALRGRALAGCQRRSKNASVSRSKNTSVMLARRPPPNWGPFRLASSLGGIMRRRFRAGRT